MYSYIKGIVTIIESDGIIIENNGIGYKIFVSNPYSYKIDKEYKMYLYNKVSEDEYSLFGFNTIEEKGLFLNLISVKGLGPKIALGMFATNDIKGLVYAIDSSDLGYLTKFPKVGEKLARQIILDLKGKLVKSEDNNVDDVSELISALTNLGYKAVDVKKVVSKVDKSLSLENQIKECLKLLLKG